jgi:hypothetical protein
MRTAVKKVKAIIYTKGGLDRFGCGRENTEFGELVGITPLHHTFSSQLDKSSVIQCIIAHLKLWKFATKSCFSNISRKNRETKRHCMFIRLQKHLISNFFEHYLGKHIAFHSRKPIRDIKHQPYFSKYVHNLVHSI